MRESQGHLGYNDEWTTVSSLKDSHRPVDRYLKWLDSNETSDIIDGADTMRAWRKYD